MIARPRAPNQSPGSEHVEAERIRDAYPRRQQGPRDSCWFLNPSFVLTVDERENELLSSPRYGVSTSSFSPRLLRFSIRRRSRELRGSFFTSLRQVALSSGQTFLSIIREIRTFVVRSSKIRKFFPDYQIHLRRIPLATPIGRIVGRYSAVL
jgi:hypothetical protein